MRTVRGCDLRRALGAENASFQYPNFASADAADDRSDRSAMQASLIASGGVRSAATEAWVPSFDKDGFSGVMSLDSVVMATKSRDPRSFPTSKDVAVLAGVSQSTVSYVMSGKRSISEDTRHRVEKAIGELAYHPNAGARALRGAKTNVIALIVQLGVGVDLQETSPYIETIIDAARQRDFDLVLSTTDEGPRGIERLAGRRISDGFVLMDVRTRDDRVETAAALGVPVVLLGRTAFPHGLDQVDFDCRHAAELLVDELVETGHRHIVVVGDVPREQGNQVPFIEEFWAGARNRAHDRAVELRIVHREGEGWAGIQAVADSVLHDQGNRLGLIARDPRMTEWLLQLLRVRGLRAGIDVSLVSMCTDTAAEVFVPAVTNVSAKAQEVSLLAMKVLFERIDGDEQPPRLELVPPSGVTRRATTVIYA